MQHRIDEATKRYEHLLKETSTVKTLLVVTTFAYIVITIKSFMLLADFLLGGVTFSI